MRVNKALFPGLTESEVRERYRAGLYNKSVDQPSKTVKEIILSNIFTYFNMVFLVIAAILILVKSYRDLTFLPVIIANTLIGIFQELKSKMVLDKIKVLHSAKARVIRDSKEQIIDITNLVVDDVVIFRSGDEIPADATILSGEVAVNEALLTGEADELVKKDGDDLLSGSFVVYGECYAKLTKVGASSYVSQLTLKAKAIKAGEQSEIIKSLNRFVKIAGILIIPIGIIMFSQQFFFEGHTAKASVQSMVAAIIGMIPEGLFLLASMTLALSAMRLALSKVMLHDMKSIEMLARVDTLCVDKTGTITEGKMEVVEASWIGDGRSALRDKLEMMIAEVASLLSPENETMAAIKRKFKRDEANSFRLDDFAKVVKVIPFSSKYKYSGVEFEGGTFVIGAPEIIMRDGVKRFEKQIDEYSSQGLRVLVFGKINGKIIDAKKIENDKGNSFFNGEFLPYGLIVLRNKIRESAAATFKYFAEQNVEVKVISGDNARTVSEIAKQVGIVKAEKYIDVSTITSQKEFDKAVMKYNVFGRVTPNQKRRIIKILKENGRTVAMTGDGVNDVLALKDADCSVAMASGAEAAVSVSQLVLLDSDFARMPAIVSEGRRVVNNLERSGSLFIVKNIFSIIMALLTIGFSVRYPLIPTQVSLVTMFTIGVPSFFLAQIPNTKLIKGNFMKNIIKSALPTSLSIVLLLAFGMILGHIFNIQHAMLGTICTMVWAIVGIMHLLKICRPFNEDVLKKVIVFGCALGMVLCMIFMKDLFGLEKEISLAAWLVFGALAAVSYPVMLFFGKLMDKIYLLLEKKKV